MDGEGNFTLDIFRGCYRNIRFNQHKGYLVASMKYSQMNTIDMVSSSQ